MSSLQPRLPTWGICPRCCRPHADANCPNCHPPDDEEAQAQRNLPLLPPPAPPAQPQPIQQSGRAANPELGGLTLGALGVVPLLGLVFCVLGVVLSMAALRSARAGGRSPRLAYLALAVSLTTAVPGILLWGWLRAAAAAW